MNQPQYQLKAEKSLMVFEFVSEGSKGQISKLIKFSETSKKGVYNLGFGDKDQATGEIDDKIVSNNGDSEKVLATVVSALYVFTDKYPDYWVFATGSNRVRTRLYRMGITKYITEVKKDFEIYGLANGTWELFKKNIDYEAFLAKRKNN